MFDWVFLYFEFLQNFFIFWWDSITNVKHWWVVPLLLFGFILSTFMILGLTWFVVLFFYNVSLLSLFGLQRFFKFNIPIIGNYLETSLKESQERIKRDEQNLDKFHKSNLVIIWENRVKKQIQFSDKEFDFMIKVFKLDKERKELSKILPDESVYEVQKWSLITENLTTSKEMSEEDRDFLQKEYENGNLERWFQNGVNNL